MIFWFHRSVGKTLVAGFLSASIFPTPSSAAEVWECLSSDVHTLAQFHVSEQILHATYDGHVFRDYHLVKDSSKAIAAADETSDVDGNMATIVIMLDKTKKTYVSIVTSFEKEIQREAGKCEVRQN